MLYLRLRQKSLEDKLVGTAGFEPATTWPPAKCATRLRYAPQSQIIADAFAHRKFAVLVIAAGCPQPNFRALRTAHEKAARSLQPAEPQNLERRQ